MTSPANIQSGTPSTTPPEAHEPMFTIAPEVLSSCESIEAEMEEITYRLNLLRLATREEIDTAIGATKKGSAPNFLLALLAESRELKVTDIEAAISSKNAEAKAKGKAGWTSPLNIIRGNTNIAIAKTGLELRRESRRRGEIWRLESGKVQYKSALPADKRESYLASATTRHEKVSEIAAKTEDKKTKYLLSLVAQQTAGIRLAEIVEVFDETLTKEELIEFIGTTNTELLAQIDAKIHIRNSIAIIGPQNPHWESKTGEPILVDDMDSIYKLATRNRQGTSAKIKAALLNKETPEQTIARLTEENSKLQAAMAQEPAKAGADLTEKLTAAEARIKDLSEKLQETLRRLGNTERLLAKANQDAGLAEAARIEARKAIERKTAALEGGQSEEIARLERLLGNTIARARDAETRSAELSAQLKELAVLRQQATETATLRAQMEAVRARIQELSALNKKLTEASSKPAEEIEALKTRIATLESENRASQELLDSLTAPTAEQPPTATPDSPVATPATTTAPETPTPPKHKPPESPSPIKDLEDAKTFETSEALYSEVERAVKFGSTLNPKGMPKGTYRRIRNAVKNLRTMPPRVEALKTRLLGLLEKMKGQGEVIPHDEIQKFLQATL